MDNRNFILCRDRSESRRIRRIVAESGFGFNVQVGTWIELVQAATDAYLLSETESHWNDSLANALEQLPDCFWSKSYTVAPAETTAVISRELDNLIRSLPPGKDIPLITNTDLSRRGQQHLADLKLLHQGMGGALPADLEATTKLLNTSSENILRCLNVHVIEEISLLNPWQEALITKLNKDNTAQNSDMITNLLQKNLIPSTGDKTTALDILQADLFQNTMTPSALDSSLQWLAARDYLEEVEVVAGMIQKSHQKSGVAYADVALLLPGDPTYSIAVQDVFFRAGLPVSGLIIKQQNRDLGHEVVFHLLQTLRKPAPTMAMAAFVTSPLLPWSKEQGFEIAAKLMNGDYALKKMEFSTAAENGLLDLIRHGVDTVSTLKNILTTFSALLNDRQELTEHRSKAAALCQTLVQQLVGVDTIPWDTLLTVAAPYPDTVEVGGDFTREGIAVFYEHEEPWRTVKTLYVLGFKDGHYPSDAGTSPVFSDADITALRSQGMQLARAVDTGDHQRALFYRQLQVAEENIHFLLSRRDPYGKPLSPSASLPFMAQLFSLGDEPEALILELDIEEGRNKAVGLAFANKGNPIPARLPEIKDLKLDNNLLEISKNHDGSVRPQSPSSLETLMTSPLAWLLNRAGLEPKEWEPEKLDVMSKGTLAHAVFENLFAPGQPLPAEEEVRQRVPTLLLEAIISIRPFLNRPEWRVERYHLEKETLTAALRWREVLAAIGAKVLGVEVWLTGFLNQQPIHGSADLLLELPDGKIFVVDYKKSSSKKRKERMGKGFDSQASLYRIMLQTGEGKFRSSEGSTVTIEADREIGALYYLMNDQVALADTAGWIAESLGDFEELGADVSANALPLIRDRISQVKRGDILLNKETDEVWYEKNAGIPLYALDNSPLIRMFMHQSQDEGE